MHLGRLVLFCLVLCVSTAAPAQSRCGLKTISLSNAAGDPRSHWLPVMTIE
ncbi:MAG: hypothetical protein H7327_04460 [Herminiimonas sp.]|nr:hypothetical protein [Herminiimonas sp.]